MLPKKFDSYEIHPCIIIETCDKTGKQVVEQCDDIKDADFFTLYGHVTGEGIFAIGDFKNYADAKEIYAQITGELYDDYKIEMSREYGNRA